VIEFGVIEFGVVELGVIEFVVQLRVRGAKDGWRTSRRRVP
jgi:hypothetical protein